MSLEGAKVSSKLEPPTTDIKLKLDFLLNEQQLNIDCNIVWRKLGFKKYIYGVPFDTVSYDEARLLAELKDYVAKSK